MDRIALHLEIRNALELADELGRYEHALGKHAIAGDLAALRTTLGGLERDVGRSHALASVPPAAVVESTIRSVSSLLASIDEVPAHLRPRLGALVASADRVVFALERPDELVRSKPVLGVLPLRRRVPQVVHSARDYGVSLACLAAARASRTRQARAASAVLGLSCAAVTAATDARLGVTKTLPIETHEVFDYAWGTAAILAPFVLGYAKRDPITAAIHVVTGLGTILVSLFTDYRAEKGVAWPIRSRGGPDAPGGKHRSPGNVGSGAQRPLEGFSSAPTDWRSDEYGSAEDSLKTNPDDEAGPR